MSRMPSLANLSPLYKHGHAQGYQEYQPELAVRCPLYAVDAFILRLGGGSDSISGDVTYTNALILLPNFQVIRVNVRMLCVLLR